MLLPWTDLANPCNLYIHINLELICMMYYKHMYSVGNATVCVCLENDRCFKRQRRFNTVKGHFSSPDQAGDNSKSFNFGKMKDISQCEKACRGEFNCEAFTYFGKS